MSRRKKKKGSGESSVDPNGWMVTFSDLLTLLLTFFVLLLTMSSMDTKALQSMFAAFLGSADVLGYSDMTAIEPYNFLVISHIPPHELSKMLERIMRNYREGKTDYDFKRPEVKITSSKNSVFVTFPVNILFKAGGVDIMEESLPVLKELNDLVKKTDYRIRIEGHTDSVSVIDTDSFSNWQISAKRSMNIMRYFLGEGMPSDRLTAVGYGEYRPIFPNDTIEHRERNRRVEIILERVIK